MYRIGRELNISTALAHRYSLDMDLLSPQDVLELWETTWGPLDERWKESFLNHKDMVEIISYGYRQIDFCIRKTRKLDQLLEILRATPLIRVQGSGGGPKGNRHISEYGRLTIKSPGRHEEILPGRSTCPSCGMTITGNDSRCKCD